ncbi:hypothetical protein JD844_011511 [Phrynosoma platyrhinos]|uniref:Spermatogenesis-associated protein 20-like TRX domain-containing protein n=1 Tax=Phrynosoma platyrhinos TaxID=52577 RepID=A0ABQ7TIK4_PHRPL|nr:hypothetical protein JD844_011511 [Phrynosoma platyrhinos]
MATGGKGSHSSDTLYTNRLIHEKSPYLLQHAHNPVDCIVGYSTCHWCHVMEHESFQNEETGKILNENFVCIKVDREERPDVDKVYMTFVQATSSGGGWPMSVWLTPDLKPFVGGTYFPPEDGIYQVGFRTVLLRILDQWKRNRTALLENSQKILSALSARTDVGVRGGETPPSSKEVMTRCFQQLSESYDEEYGGFSESPKFPTPVNLNFLFSYWALHRSTSEGARALQMALHTLKMMAYGGIHDHIAQGFHRYSTDQRWHVPHFEKMLYDQGQLAVVYAKAFQTEKIEEHSGSVDKVKESRSHVAGQDNGHFRISSASGSMGKTPVLSVTTAVTSLSTGYKKEKTLNNCSHTISQKQLKQRSDNLNKDVPFAVTNQRILA